MPAGERGIMRRIMMWPDRHSRHWRPSLDGLLVAAVFAALAAIYLATLLPGLGGTEDTPKFQYVGAALGTPHDPGYPLYMIACWAFSKLPVGTLAYRINLLSACWGALAGALVFLAMRRLAVPRGIAVCTALALGLGRAFWQHSTFAEAYTQASALTAAAFLALLIWDEDGRTRWLYAAVAAVSLAFGTHLIIVGMVPVFAWFVLTRYRWRVPVRALAVIAVIVTLGVAQYGYVWIRTVQHARYLESSARSVTDMVGVLRGRQFENQTFTEPLAVVSRERVPEVAAAAAADLGPLASVAALVGVLALWRTRRRAAALLAFGFIGSALLLASLGNVATEGIQLPSLMAAWILAGCGASFAWTCAAAVAGWRLRVAACAAVAVTVAAMPARQAWQNYEVNNYRNDTYYTDYFRALVDVLDGPTVFLREDYIVKHMLEYTRYTTQVADVSIEVDRHPASIARFIGEGIRVYAFRQGFDALDGYVRARPVTLTGLSLETRLRWMRNGKIIAMAGFTPVWPDVPSLALGSRDRVKGRAVVIAVKGVGPAVVTGPGFEGVVEVREGEPLGKTGHLAPVSIRVEVRGTRASIAVDGLPIVQTDVGLAVAEIGANLEAHYVLRPETAFKAPIDMGLLRLYRIVETTPADSCTPLPPGTWTRLANPGREGRLVAHIPGDEAIKATWAVYLAGDRPLPASVAQWPWSDDPVVSVETFELARDSDRLRAVLAADGIDDAVPLLASPEVTRVSVKTAADKRPGVLRLNLGGLPERAWARVATDAPMARPPTICAGPVLPLEPEIGTEGASVYLGPGGDWYFGDGWHNAEPAPAGYYRRTAGSGAALLLPIARPAALTLRLSVEALDGARAMAPVLNGHRLTEQSLTVGWNELAWPVDAAGWRAGVNMLSLEVLGPAAGAAGARGGAVPAGATAAPAGTAPSLRVRRIALDWSEAKSIRD